MKNIFFVLSAAALLLVGCGNNKLNPTTPKVTPKDTPQKGTGCPSIAPDALHTVTVTFPRALPTRIALKLPGDGDLRVTECNTPIKQTGVTASLMRVSSPPNTVVITVHHNYTFVQNGTFTPPQGQAFELLATNCDASPPISLYKQTTPVPLSWISEHTNGATCAEQDIGSGAITVTALQAQNGDDLDY
ncbi:MAG: hypothetical protein ACXWP1_04570 [Bdellovibrionota bacterium]